MGDFMDPAPSTFSLTSVWARIGQELKIALEKSARTVVVA